MARPPCAETRLKRPVASPLWTQRPSNGRPAAKAQAASRRARRPYRPSATATPAAATASGRSTISISWRTAAPAA